MNFEGWLLDATVSGSTAKLRFKTKAGEKVSIVDDYRPEFYLVGDFAAKDAKGSADGASGDAAHEATEIVAETVSNHPLVHSATVESRFPSVMSAQKGEVVRVRVSDTYSYKKVLEDMKLVPGRKELAETSMPHPFKYAAEKGLDFFSEYRVKVSGVGGKLEGIEEISSESIPPLCFCSIVRNGPRDELRAFLGEEFFDLSQGELSGFVSKNNIDVLISLGGDEYLDGAKKTVGNSGGEKQENAAFRHHHHFGESNHSAFGGFSIPDCFHLDISKDLGVDIYSDIKSVDDDLAAILKIGRERMLRIIELSRISGARPDAVSRIAPGRLNSYIHYREAKKMGYVVPDVKKGVEKPKTLRTLLSLDKGGTILYPAPGKYSNVAKLDFASMYPSVIVNYNISPETTNCGCCKEPLNIPGIPWSFCRRRKGIIPSGIEKVLRRRLELKRLMKLEKDLVLKRELEIRQKALKVILVTCFGYLGFNNFVFSNVECKESTVCIGRHLLERTKKIVEDAGLAVIYGVVDSVFVTGGDLEAYKEVARKVSGEIKIGLELDCVFSSIVFPASASSGGGSVANRYYGVTTEGEVESRGIAIRRRDCCKFVYDFQTKAIWKILNGEGGLSQLRAEFLGKLKRGEVAFEDLVISKSISRDLDSYKVRSAHIDAFRQAPSKDGVARYVLTDSGPVPAFFRLTEFRVDAGGYERLLENAMEELVRGTKS